MLDYVVFGNPLMNWLIAAAFPVVGIIIARVLISLLAVIGKRAEGLLQKIIEAMNSPILWAGFIVGFRFGMATLTFSDSIKSSLFAAVAFIIVLLLTWCMARAYNVIHEHILIPYVKREDTGVDLTLLNVLSIRFGCLVRAAR